MTSPRSYYLGLFAVTLTTLALEIVNTRVFSVLTHYHLAFFAVSLAMLGMTAAAVYVFLRPARFEPAAVAAATARWTMGLAVSIPLSHLYLLALRVPHRSTLDAVAIWSLTATSAVCAVPFFFSGVVVTLALTRTTLPVGRLYGIDLAGAALGCLASIPIMGLADPTSLSFVLGALAALGAIAFWRSAGKSPRAAVALAGVLLAAGALNASRYPELLRIAYMKGRPVARELEADVWNSHSRVTVERRKEREPFYWGRRGDSADDPKLAQIRMRIDGAAFTNCTRFSGDPETLQWVRKDVTSLAYHLRGTGRVAIIGLGGGRDVLTALGFGARHVTAIEINRIFLDLHRGPLRRFSQLADRPDVELVHEEGRVYLTRSRERWDLLQMSLIDTWASTAAGAMTLTENGLYTTEAWSVFLERLAPGGIFAVSRWYSPEVPGETARSLSVAVDALLARGSSSPRRHLALATAGSVSTLVVARDPLTSADLSTLSRASERHGFEILADPDRTARDPQLRRILAATTPDELASAAAHDFLDLTPARDERPFFFNATRLGAWRHLHESKSRRIGGIIEGNLRATTTLVAILISVSVLVLASILVPLLFGGRGSGLDAASFAAGAAYFSLIGLGFMLAEIAFMQRFAILLGHPVYSIALTLLSMILAAGVGSLLSDRVEPRERRSLWLPSMVAAALLGLAALGLGPAIRLGMPFALPVRAMVVLAFTAPVGLVLGLFFPLGLRRLRSRSAAATSWMWGLNGAFGVLGSVLAVFISVGWGISFCLAVAAACYLATLVPAFALARREAAELP
ncbi:MAG TPA: hypothetical protein VI942_07640 [Thermoanaerobaculia bacterium]|nr:hypothetical protein [Thermoanaerobaculia bacterium]